MVGVQGLAEAPWLDLNTPAATSGWWARSATLPPASVHDTGQPSTGPLPTGPADTDPRGPSRPAGNGQSGTGQFGVSQFGMGQFNGGGREDSHTLVVDREEGGRYQGGREPFLSRWLFGPRLLIVVLIIGLGVGLGLGGWWLTSGRYAQVPAVAGDSVTQATAVLTADGFTVKRGARVPSNAVAKGRVASTSPTGRVTKGSTIALLVSSGPFTSVVPTVKGDKQAAAEAALQRVHLTSTPQRVASNAAVGTVVGTNPPAGTTWPQTKPVTILVAAGPPLPEFIGMNIDTAKQLANQDQVSLQEQSDPNSQQPAGTIIGQEPAAGAMYRPGQTVIVRVSAGPQLVPVPNVIGMSVQQATQALQAAGFQVQVNSFTRFGKVFAFSPVGEAPRGSTITIDSGF